MRALPWVASLALAALPALAIAEDRADGGAPSEWDCRIQTTTIPGESVAGLFCRHRECIHQYGSWYGYYDGLYCEAMLPNRGVLCST